MNAYKQFLIIGNMNAVTYREVFPFIQKNMVWLGATGFVTDMVFGVPEGAIIKESDKKKAERLGYIGNYTRLGNSCWFTNMDHGRRHQPLPLMTMADNLKFSRHKGIKGRSDYIYYDNYKAIEVPFTDAIPNDFSGVMGVPVSFIDKYCPEQFEIIWRGGDIEWCENECDFYTPPTQEMANHYKNQDRTWRIQNPYYLDESGNAMVVYQRIFIRKKQ